MPHPNIDKIIDRAATASIIIGSMLAALAQVWS